MELDEALRRHLEAGGGALLITATLPHHHGEALADVWGRLSRTWTRLMGGRGPEMLRAHGWVGMVRAVELTHGGAGWHVHVHAIALFAAPLSLEAHAAVLVMLRDRWARVAGVEVHSEHALDVRAVTAPDGALAAYVTGWSTGAELARSDAKHGRQGGRTPMELLEAATDGDRHAWALWLDLLRVSKGRRALVWSRGLRARLLPEPEQTDEEVAAEHSVDAVTVLHVDRDVWRALLGAQAVTAMLDHLEHHGPRGLVRHLGAGGVRTWLDSRGVGPPVLRLRLTPQQGI